MATCETLRPSPYTMKIPHSHSDVWQMEPSTEVHLVSLTKTLINIFNARVYDHPIFHRHILPNIRVDLNGEVGYGIETFKGNYKVTADASPAFYADLFNESAMVDDFRGTAAILFSQDLTWHSSEGRRMSAAIVFNWERQAGNWLCNAVCIALSRIHNSPFQHSTGIYDLRHAGVSSGVKWLFPCMSSLHWKKS